VDCPSCHRHNPDENRFCWNCGARLQATPRDGALGAPKARGTVTPPLDEERARERKRRDEVKRRILVRGTVVGALVAGAIGAFVGVVTGLARGPGSEQAWAMGVKLYAVLSGITGALQGATAGAMVGAIVVMVGGGGDTGWRAGALVNAVAYTALFIFKAIGWADWIVLIGAGAVLWAYFVGLVISVVLGALYGWIIGTFVESSLERW